VDDEGAFHRAWRLGKQYVNRFLVGGVLLGAVAAFLAAGVAAPATAQFWERIAYAVGSFLAGVGIVAAGAFIVALLRAPYVQRNEARADVKALHVEVERLQAPRPAPALRLDTRLESDTAARCIRLRVWNDSASATRPDAQIVEIIDETGKSLIDRTQLPLDLEWTNHPEGPPLLSGQDATGQTVAVFGLDDAPNAAEAVLFAFGRKHQPPIGRVHDQLLGRKITVTVAVRSPEYPEVGATVRRYVIQQEPISPLKFRV
jgi:hypothetical protein